MINTVLPLSSKNLKLCGFESKPKAVGWNYESRESDPKTLSSVHSSSGGGKESCKVLSHGTGRAAEGVETNEMESLQSKFVFFFIYIRALRKKEKKRFPQANNDIIQRFGN